MIFPFDNITIEIEPLQIIIFKIIDTVIIIIQPGHRFIHMPDNHSGTGHQEIIFTCDRCRHIRIPSISRSRSQNNTRRYIATGSINISFQIRSRKLIKINLSIFNQKIFMLRNRYFIYFITRAGNFSCQ